MVKSITSLILILSFISTISISHAETANNSRTTIEGANVTIRMTNNQPYAEFQPCDDCPYRLLSFTPTAQIYLNGEKTTASALQDGQTMEGTVFIQQRPIESIIEIVAN
ncbi:MAG TPA: hypothetical protein VFF22_01475 [Pseudomonas sp.]|nr:hypothetical protein [Pseudomonas sp.]